VPRVPAAAIDAPNASRAMTTVELRQNITNKGMGAGCPVEVAKSQVVSMCLFALERVRALQCALLLFCVIINYREGNSPNATTT